MGTKRFLNRIRSAALVSAVLVFAFANIGNIALAATAPEPTPSTGTPRTAADLAPINERAISWQVLRLLVEDQCRFADKIETTKALEGDFNNGGGNNDVSVGHIIGPEKGVMPCKDALIKGVNLWANGDTVGFFKTIGYEEQGQYLVAKTYSSDVLAAGIPARFFFTTNRGAADYALLYYIFRQDFIAGCKATVFKEVSKATADEIKAATTDDNTYRIKDVQPDGTVKDMLYKAEGGKGDVISVGYGIGTTNAGKADCQEIATKLNDNNLVQGYTAILGIDTSAAGALTQSVATSTNTNDGCYSFISVFGWIMCPMLDLADGIFGFLKSSIYSLLAIPELSTANSNGLKASWNAVKNVANAALILVALFMIGSQIFNFKFVDAYTVKKVLPRLVIAAILIQLSWFLFTGLMSLFNALGYSINTLITAPFQAAGGGDIIDILGNQSASAVNTAGIFASLGAAVGVAAAATALSSGGFLTLAMVAIGVIVSIVLVVLTLIVRKLLLFALLVTAPIALVAWILPGTQKYWTTWWNLFIKLLIMFPLIAILFAAGQIFASVAASSPATNAAGNGVNVIIIVIAYFAPLFLIPATFKFAGGIFGSIVGGINNIGGRAKKSGFGLKEQRDAIKKYDGEARARAYSERAREKRQNLLQNDSRSANARARMGMGLVGLGKYGTKVLEKEKTAGAQRIAAEKYDEAVQEYSNLFKGIPDTRGDQALVASAASGETVTLSNGKTMAVTPEISKYNYLQSLASKNHSAATAFEQSAAAETALLPQGQVSPKQEVLNTLMQTNFGDIDAKRPQVTRGAIGIDKIGADGNMQVSGSVETAVSGFNNLSEGKPMTVKNPDGTTRTVTSDDAKSAVLTTISRLQGGTTQDKATAAGYLNKILSNSDITKADIARIGTVYGIDASAVADSQGALRVSPNANGGFDIVSSSSAPTPRQDNSQTPGQDTLF